MSYALVIFDMDGTLTQANEDLLNFARIRTDIGLAGTGPLLEDIRALPPDQQRRALEILHKHERHAAERCVLQEGAVELLADLRAMGVKTALLTRNSAVCTSLVLQHYGLTFDHVATREDLPHKPHPDSILNITRKLGVASGEALMVGDFIYDLQAAQRADVDSVLLCTAERPAFAGMATYCIKRLADLRKLIRQTA